jgi:hypothetical protein
VTFYTRLSRLMAIIEKDFNISDFFPQLNPGLHITLTRNNQKDSNLSQLVKNTQEVWGTFVNKQQQKCTHSPGNSKPNQVLKQSSNPRSQQLTSTLSKEEYQQHINDQLCFNCSKPGHIARDYKPQRSLTPKP